MASGVEDSRSGNGSGVAEGYDIHLFLELPPKDLTCTKCEKVLREPHQAECGHLYCGQCISATEDSPCHCCGRNLRPRACSKDYQRDRRILELRVRCPERGCQWEGELQNLEIHRKEQCAYRVVECEFRYAGCMASGTASEMKEHFERDTQQHLCFIAKYFQTQLEQLQRERSVSATAGTLQEEVEVGETNQHHHESRAGGGDIALQEGQRAAKPCITFECGFFILAAMFVVVVAMLYQHKTSPDIACATHPVLPLVIAIPIPLRQGPTLLGETWQSVPFYSHIRGYKMHIVIETSRFLLFI